MRILVTGGAGFIGSQLSRRLLVEGHRVVVVDNLFTGFRHNVPDGAEWVEGDVGKETTIEKLPGGDYDVVCHLAAQSSGAISMEQPLYDIQTNAVSTALLIRWCRKRGVRRFIYASSMAVYGNPERSPVDEGCVLAPLSFYGVSKLASEHLLRVAGATFLRPTALRMFNVYGPGQNLLNLRQGMASIYLAYLLKGEEVPVTGSLDRFRDFVYIDDVIDAWVQAIRLRETESFAYNVGSGCATTVRDLLGVLIEACGLRSDFPVRQLPALAGDQFGLSACIQRSITELGWRAQMPLCEGMQRMVAWARCQSNV